MARLIDVDKALAKLRKVEPELKVVSIVGIKAVSIGGVIDFLERQKTVDAAEVVLCKDCKHCRVSTSKSGGAAVCDRSLPSKPLEDNFYSNVGIFAIVKPNDFCSRGERRTDE